MLAGSMATAAVIGFSGQVALIATPALVNNATPGDTNNILVFNEVQNLLVGPGGLTLGSLNIAAGQRINSHMVLLNRGGPDHRKTGPQRICQL